MSDRPAFGVVILTMGTRPDDLARGIASVLAQQDVDTDIVGASGMGFFCIPPPARVL